MVTLGQEFEHVTSYLQIQEHGKHEELMQKDGEYHHLYESQMALENYGRQVNRDV